MASESDEGTGTPARSAFDRLRSVRALDPEEHRRRAPSAVAMDVLYLFTTAFFGLLAVEGFWPAIIAGIPLAFLLYFGLRSSVAFFVAQLAAIALSLAASSAGYVPF